MQKVTKDTQSYTVPQCCQINFSELKCRRKLLQQLPRAVQKQQENWTLQL